MKQSQIPYYAVIFTSIQSDDNEGYEEMDALTFKEVEQQRGYLGAETFSNKNGYHVTIAYFKTEKDILEWKNHALHKEAQKLGKERWYDFYNVKVCKVEREYEFNN